MKLYHTSPAEINEVYDDGLFGSHVFFSDRIYVTTAGDYLTYEIEIEEEEIIESCCLFYPSNVFVHLETVKQVMERFNVNEEVAVDLIDESISITEIQDDFDGEKSWWIQKMTAKAAKCMGYNAVCVKDETGNSYMLDLRVYREKMNLVK